MSDDMEIVIPLGERVLVRKEEESQVTKGGIVLPDDVKIGTLIARVLEIGKIDPLIDLKQYDRVLIDPANAIPVSLDPSDKSRRYVVPVVDIIAVFRKGKSEKVPVEECIK